MGCACLTALAAWISPRLAIFLLWLFGWDRFKVAYDSFLIAFIGFLFLPWTMLAYAASYEPLKGVSGFGWFVVTLAFLVDVSSYFSGEKARRSRG